jgi:hypothetical protein
VTQADDSEIVAMTSFYAFLFFAKRASSQQKIVTATVTRVFRIERQGVLFGFQFWFVLVLVGRQKVRCILFLYLVSCILYIEPFDSVPIINLSWWHGFIYITMVLSSITTPDDLHTPTEACEFPSSDYQVLEDLYTSTGGND